MGSHPVQLALRFLLELAALAALGLFAWTRFDGPWKWVALFALPLLFMVLWGTFAVPGDPSRSGSAPVPTPGVVRLLLELTVFSVAYVLLALSGWPRAAIALGVVTVAHYALSWDRIAWLLQR